ncbi:MAG: DUF2157 domain-containing protein [Zhongshania sp.]|uniref:DUF2157 domain-containing protein n=1 Tax=Zhongshania sp. TaxID=1971902 RepID=UPI0026373363|nr:DUF2157 domain-containing protein [Zhongshania sp.]MDF1691899.1 DUF2157 domain-containing protein [Zhongshania sp.]
MENNNPWLRAEIAQWLREGIINDEQAKVLYARYPAVVVAHSRGRRLGSHSNSSSAGGGHWGKVIFAALGVAIFGMGVVLLFAYNWGEMHRYLKLAVIGLSILLAHGVGMAMFRVDGPRRRVGESLHLLGTLLFGAGIWLVAQIYHFDAHYPDGFLLWCLAAMSMAWALPSAAQGILAAVLLLLWSGLETFEFQQAMPQASWILLLGLLPLAWWQRSSSLLAVVLVSLPLAYIVGVWTFGEQFLAPVLLLLTASYFAFARLSNSLGNPAAESVFNDVGVVLWLLLIFIGTFIGLPSQAGMSAVPGFGLLQLLFPLLLATGLWLWVLISANSRPQGVEAWLESGLVLAVLIVVVVPAMFGANVVGVGRLVFNLVFLTYSLLYVYRGTEHGRGKILALGCVMISVLALARFTDLFYSLLARSSVFLILGGVLFVIGQRYAKQNTRRILEKPRA